MILTKSVLKMVDISELELDHSKDIHFEMVDLKHHSKKILFPFNNSYALAIITIIDNSYMLLIVGDNQLYDLHYNYISKDLQKCYCMLTRLKNGDFKAMDEMIFNSGLTYHM